MEYNFIEEIRLCGIKATAKRVRNNLLSRGIFYNLDTVELTLLQIWKDHYSRTNEELDGMV